MNSIIKYCLFLILLTPYIVLAQSRFEYEIGGFAGAVGIQSDYGLRDDLKALTRTTTIAAGAVNYIGAPSYGTYFFQHFKLRNEVSFCKVNYENTGQYVNKKTVLANQLRAMYGSSTIVNSGFQLEFMPLNTFGDSPFLTPYIGVGTFLSVSMVEAKSYLGPNFGTDPSITPEKYLNAVKNGTVVTGSFVFNIGTRIYQSDYSNLFVEFRTQFYFSDWVDGLNSDKRIYTENKFNESMLWFNVGYNYLLY